MYTLDVRTALSLPRITMAQIRRFTLFAVFALLPLTQAQGEVAELTFTYWGSPQEKSAIEAMITDFNGTHPNIHVRGQYISNTGYDEKISTMVASGTPPDVAYMNAGLAFAFAKEGALLDLSEFFAIHAGNKLESTFYRYNKTIFGASIGEITLMYYRKDLFDEAGLAYPPSRAQDAWSWEQFVEVAQKLTKDQNGNDALSPDFDPNRIDTYGVSVNTTINGYLPLIMSNGGRFASEDGTKLLLNSPEAVEALQKMQNLIYKYHVAPSPTQVESLPSSDILMQTGKVAMDINGHWKVLDYSQLQNLDWGMAVLPRLKEPATMLQASARVVFAATDHPEEALEFFQFHTNPEYVDLFRKGLWMPDQRAYYTDPTKITEWLEGEEGVYPPEAKDVLVDYTLNNIPLQSPAYWLVNQNRVFSEAINPAMELLWLNKLTAQEAMDQAVAKGNPLMTGN